MKKRKSTQALMGLETFGKFGLCANRSELAFFHVQPTNISVLSAEHIDTKIHQLTQLLSVVPELEIIALDSCERFDENKIYLKNRIAEERNSQVRMLLKADLAHISELQTQHSTARQFLFCIRFRNAKSEQLRQQVSRVHVTESIHAENNLQDVVQLIAELRRNKEPLLHTAVFIDLKAESEEKLRELQSDIRMELTRAHITVDPLLLRQKEGFLSVLPFGNNQFGALFERILPASSVANLYPLNYSGKTDPQGFYIGHDRYGTNILVDFDRRSDDKTNSNVLILGNSGQGKSYLMKLLLTNLREAGKSVIVLDAEAEYEDLARNLGGTYLDFMSGQYRINPLEPKAWNVDADAVEDAPEAFQKATRLRQHISYLKDFFRAYKDFSDSEIDTIELMLLKLYTEFGLDDSTDFERVSPREYPIMQDLYDLIEHEYKHFDTAKKHLYTEEILQNICLGLHSMCKGAESTYFNGHTNIRDGEFLCFGVKGLLDTNKRLKDTLLFNVLSYMSGQLLTKGNTVAAIDEAYLFLSNMTAIEYIRNAMKRVRKKDSAMMLASQNIDDFLIPEVKEFTKPLFAIPTHQFLFYAGNIEPKAYMDTLQLEQSEFRLILHPARGSCLYRCGNERYLLQVKAPEYKEKLFGKAGGR